VFNILWAEKCDFSYQPVFDFNLGFSLNVFFINLSFSAALSVLLPILLISMLGKTEQLKVSLVISNL